MIKEQEINKNTLAYKEFEHIDYADCFVLNNIKYNNIDDFAKNYFLSQPLWLNIISQGVFSKKSIEDKINISNFGKDTSIGSWKIYNRDENEIVFGDDMGFMEYRFTMIYNKDENNVQVATVVQYKGSMGKYYFSIVKLLHKKFVMMSLENSYKK